MDCLGFWVLNGPLTPLKHPSEGGIILVLLKNKLEQLIINTAQQIAADAANILNLNLGISKIFVARKIQAWQIMKIMLACKIQSLAVAAANF